jgi:hypothetical protein
MKSSAIGQVFVKVCLRGGKRLPITHSKFMMLLSLLNNPDIAPAAVGNLKKVHGRALSDDYYSGL